MLMTITTLCKARNIFDTSNAGIAVSNPPRGLHFLGSCGKSRMANIDIVMSVRPSAENNSAPTGRIFMKFDI